MVQRLAWWLLGIDTYGYVPDPMGVLAPTIEYNSAPMHTSTQQQGRRWTADVRRRMLRRNLCQTPGMAQIMQPSPLWLHVRLINTV